LPLYSIQVQQFPAPSRHPDAAHRVGGNQACAVRDREERSPGTVGRIVTQHAMSSYGPHLIGLVHCQGKDITQGYPQFKRKALKDVTA
jgi:hypothetical protein